MEKDAPEMLTLKMIKGDWSGLNDPHAILLSSIHGQSACLAT